MDLRAALRAIDIGVSWRGPRGISTQQVVEESAVRRIMMLTRVASNRRGRRCAAGKTILMGASDFCAENEIVFDPDRVLRFGCLTSPIPDDEGLGETKIREWRVRCRAKIAVATKSAIRIEPQRRLNDWSVALTATRIL